MNLTIRIPELIIKPFLFFVLAYRKFRFGYPFRRIKLTEGKFAIVDPEDYKNLTKFDWFLSIKKYASAHLDINGIRTQKSMHQLIMPAEPGLVIDHINRDRLDNRKINLRIATHSQNQCNRATKPHSSRFRGVSRNKYNRWVAYINHLNKTIYLGVYSDQIEAAKVYDRAARKYHGQFATLNFPNKNNNVEHPPSGVFL